MQGTIWLPLCLGLETGLQDVLDLFALCFERIIELDLEAVRVLPVPADRLALRVLLVWIVLSADDI